MVDDFTLNVGVEYVNIEDVEQCKISQDILKRVLCLPVYPGLDIKQIEKVIILTQSYEEDNDHFKVKAEDNEVTVIFANELKKMLSKIAKKVMVEELLQDK